MNGECLQEHEIAPCPIRNARSDRIPRDDGCADPPYRPMDGHTGAHDIHSMQGAEKQRDRDGEQAITDHFRASTPMLGGSSLSAMMIFSEPQNPTSGNLTAPCRPIS